MNVFDIILKKCPPRLYSLFVFNKNTYLTRLTSIKIDFDNYLQTMKIADLKHIVCMIKYTCEDLKMKSCDIDTIEAQTIVIDLLQFAALLIYSLNKEQLKIADEIITKLINN